MRCQVCGENEARYLSYDGDIVLLTCGICPIKAEFEMDSIKLTAVAELVKLSREAEVLLTMQPHVMMMHHEKMTELAGRLRELLGRDVTK